jgi:hypothetical protein
VRPRACLYTIAFLPRERIEALLLDEFLPLVREIASILISIRCSSSATRPTLAAPLPNLRAPGVGERSLRARLEARMAELEAEGTIEGHSFSRYIERSALRRRRMTSRSAVLHRFARRTRAARRQGPRLMGKSSRGCLLVADGLADLVGFDERQRLHFYRQGYAWALDTGAWTPADLEIPRRRFVALKPGLERLLADDHEASR